MREILNEEPGSRMDAWLDEREAELAPLVREYAGRGSEVLEEMQEPTVRREYSRTSPEIHRGYYSRNPAMFACFRNLRRGRRLKSAPKSKAGLFEYLFDGQGALIGVILYPREEKGLLCFCRILHRDGCEYDLDYTQGEHGTCLNHIWRYETEGDRIVSELLFDAQMGKASKLWYFRHRDGGILEAIQFEHLLLARLGKEKTEGCAAALLTGIPENMHCWYSRFHLKKNADGSYEER